MPQDESKLGHLLALLAELQQRRLTGIFVQEVGNVRHGAAIILGNVLVAGFLAVRGAAHVAGVGLVRG